MATFDNSYRKCYNKCNDDNKNVISHQTGKNAPTRRFAPCPYKIPLSRRKRRVANFHKFWKYKKHKIVRHTRTAGSGIPIYTQGITLLKVCHVVTKWLQLSDYA